MVKENPELYQKYVDSIYNFDCVDLRISTILGS